MNLLVLSLGGYIDASISNVTAFDKVDYLLGHGSGDNNVHFANSVHLSDMLRSSTKLIHSTASSRYLFSLSFISLASL